MTPEMQNRVRTLANQLWEEEGRPEGKEQEHWRRAVDRLSGGQEAGTSGSRTRGDPDGAQSGRTKEDVFLKATTRLTPD